MYRLMGYAHSMVLEVDIPVPTKGPNSKDILNKTDKGADWLGGRSKEFWTIIGILLVAYLVGIALRKPLIKGAAIGMVVLALLLMIAHSK